MVTMILHAEGHGKRFPNQSDNPKTKEFTMNLNRTILLLAMLLFGAAAGAEPASVLLQKGIYAEETEGDLDAAIAAYRKAVEEAKALRTVGAQAQYRLAICLKKQRNNTEAVA